MGATTSSSLWLPPDVRPDYQKDSIFDSNYGFSKPRVARKMIATEEELDAANIPPDKRDYCSHLLLKYFACREQKFPITYLCKSDRDAYAYCEYEDYVLRMKEFERERRLLERAKKSGTTSEIEAN